MWAFFAPSDGRRFNTTTHVIPCQGEVTAEVREAFVQLLTDREFPFAVQTNTTAQIVKPPPANTPLFRAVQVNPEEEPTYFTFTPDGVICAWERHVDKPILCLGSAQVFDIAGESWIICHDIHNANPRLFTACIVLLFKKAFMDVQGRLPFPPPFPCRRGKKRPID